MKILLTLTALLFLVACGENRSELNNGVDGKDGVGCISTPTSTGIDIDCNGTVYSLEHGKDGSNGIDGQRGAKGDKGDTGATGATGAAGPKGDKGDTGAQGKQGKKGDRGEQGVKGDKGDAGKDGKDGEDGEDGKDGKDAANLTSVKVKSNTCTQVARDIWVENIQNGRVFDVYYNPHCEDRHGEYCDNVLASYGSSGRVDHKEHPGSGTVCWADNVQITGHKLNSRGDIIIKVLDFN